MTDCKIANWACEKLRKKYDKPFLVLGKSLDYSKQLAELSQNRNAIPASIEQLEKLDSKSPIMIDNSTLLDLSEDAIYHYNKLQEAAAIAMNKKHEADLKIKLLENDLYKLKRASLFDRLFRWKKIT